MSNAEKCLFRQKVELQPGQSYGYFEFISNPEPDSIFAIEKAYCCYQYAHTQTSRVTPLEPISYSVVNKDGVEIIHNRLSEWNAGVADYPTPPELETDGYLVINNPNAENGCILHIAVYVEGEFRIKESMIDPLPSPTVAKAIPPKDDSWGAYIRRQQQRRKKSIGSDATPSRLPVWLTTGLLGLGVSASFIPASYFELLVCLAVL